MSKNINAFVSIRSKVDELPAKENLVDAIRGYTAVLQHTLDGVEVLMASEYKELPQDLLELRAFNESGELHVIKVNGELVGRVRTDGAADGDKCEAFDEEHLVWGERAVPRGDMVELKEDRGTRVSIPSELLRGKSVDKNHRVTVRVRNYLDDCGEDAESGDTRFVFSDYRLMGFEVREVK